MSSDNLRCGNQVQAQLWCNTSHAQQNIFLEFVPTIKSSAFCRSWTLCKLRRTQRLRWKRTRHFQWVSSGLTSSQDHPAYGFGENTCHSRASVTASVSHWAWNNASDRLLGLLPSLEFYQHWENVDNFIMNHYHLGKMREKLKANIWQIELNTFSHHTLDVLKSQSICCRSAAQYTHLHHGLWNFSLFLYQHSVWCNSDSCSKITCLPATVILHHEYVKILTSYGTERLHIF